MSKCREQKHCPHDPCCVPDNFSEIIDKALVASSERDNKIKEEILDRLHDKFGRPKNGAASVLPGTLPTDAVLEAINLNNYYSGASPS